MARINILFVFAALFAAACDPLNRTQATSLDAQTAVAADCYVDGDGDGAYVAVSLDTDEFCDISSDELPAVTELRPGEEQDCDDNDARQSPLKDEVCDGVDNDCDGQVDEGLDCRDVPIDPEQVICYPDGDNDGQGDEFGDGISRLECEADEADNNDDCDDSSRNIGDGFTEVCDDKDNDCDGQVDEGLDCDNGNNGGDQVEICVVDARVSSWQLAYYDNGFDPDDQENWVSDNGSRAVVSDPILTGSSGSSTTRCVAVTLQTSTTLLQFNGYASQAQLWHNYLVGAVSGGSYAMTDNGKASEIEVTVDYNVNGRSDSNAEDAEFCSGSFDLCWSRTK